MAVRKGFEPLIRFHVYTLSRRAPSASRTPNQICKVSVFYAKKIENQVLIKTFFSEQKKRLQMQAPD